jgi:hypothetical protein
VAGEAGTAFVKVKPDTKGFKGEAEHGILGPLKQIAVAAAGLFAVEKGIDFFKDATKDAANLEQQIFRTGAIFKGASGAVQAFAKDAAESMGETQGAALESATKFGQLFTQMGIGQAKSAGMSTSLVKLAADLAAFTNQPVDRVFQALLRGETGMTRGLKQLGIVLTDTQIKQEAFAEGLTKSTKEALTPAQKAQAIYALVMAQTARVQGTFERRSGTLGERLKILSAQWGDLKEEVGVQVLPTVLRALTAISQNAPSALGAFKDSLTDGAGAARSFLSAIQPITSVALDVSRSFLGFAGVGGIVAMVAGFKSAGLAAAGFQKAMFGVESVLTHPGGKIAGLGALFSSGGLAMTGAGVAAAGLGLILYKLATDESDTERATRRLTSAIDGLADAQRGSRDAADAKRQADQNVRESNREVARSETDIRQAIQERNRQEAVLTTLQEKRTTLIRSGTASDKQLAAAAKDVADQQKKVAASEANVVSAYQNHQRAAINLKSAQVQQKDATVDLNKANTAFRKSVNDVAGALQNIGQAANRAGVAKVGGQFAQANRGAHDFGATLDRSAIASQRAAAQFQAYVHELESAKGPNADLLHAIGEYVKSLGRVPTNKETHLILNSLKASTDLKDFKSRLDAIPTSKTVSVITTYINRVQNQAPGHVPTQFPPPPPHKALGGYVPGRRSAGDTQMIFATAGEVVLNEPEQQFVGKGLIAAALKHAGGRAGHYQAGGTVPSPTGPSGGGGGPDPRHAGRETADEILLAFLNEVRTQLPKKWKQALQDTITRTADFVRGLQSNVSDAFGSVADQAFQAFDAATQKHLDTTGKRFDKLRDEAEATLGTGLGDTIAQQLRVSMGPAFDELKPGKRAVLIKNQMQAFEKDLGKVWTGLPKDVKAGLEGGMDAVQQDVSKFDKALDDSKQRIDSWLQDQNQGIDSTLQANLDATQQWADSRNAIIDKAIEDQANAWEDAQRKQIEATRAALTPTELIVQQERAAHDAAAAANELADAQKAVADAQTQLGEAQAGTDDQAVLDAQKALADAQAQLAEVTFDQKLSADEQQAQTERDQRDAEAQAALDQLAAQADAYRAQLEANAQAERDQIAADAASRQAQAQGLADAERALVQQQADAQLADAQAQHDRDVQNRQAQYDTLVAQMQAAHDRIINELDRQQGREDTEYQATRDLLKRHLQARLAALQNELEHERDGWDHHHEEIMRLFHNITGDYHDAGQNLGQAFVRGLTESEGDLEGAAERLARAIAHYLQLHSPAEKGPLSTLHQWWKPFASTLVRGLDTSSIDSSMRRLTPPTGSSSTSYGSPGDPRIIQRLDTLIRTVEAQKPGVGRIVVQDDTGRTLNELAAAAGG